MKNGTAIFLLCVGLLLAAALNQEWIIRPWDFTLAKGYLLAGWLVIVGLGILVYKK